MISASCGSVLARGAEKSDPSDVTADGSPADILLSRIVLTRAASRRSSDMVRNGRRIAYRPPPAKPWVTKPWSAATIGRNMWGSGRGFEASFELLQRKPLQVALGSAGGSK